MATVVDISALGVKILDITSDEYELIIDQLKNIFKNICASRMKLLIFVIMK